MRIGFDAKRAFNNRTGLGNYSRFSLLYLQKYFPGNELIAYTPGIKHRDYLELFENNEEVRVRLPRTHFMTSLWRSYGILKDIEKDGIEIYHGLSNELPFGINKLKGLKTVVTIHDLIFKYLPETFPVFDRKIYDLKFREASEMADVVIAMSESTKKDIEEFYDIPSGKVKVVYPTCELTYFEPSSEEEISAAIKKYDLPQEYYITVGSITERKNQLSVVKAYNELPEAYRLPLLIVGRGKKYLQEIREYIAANNLEKQVIIRENIAETEELKAIYHKAVVDIYVSFYEGFGLPVVEGMLTKVPVITSNISSLPEAGGKAAILADPHNPAEIAASIIKIMDDSELRTRMISEGFDHAHKKFSPYAAAEGLINIYKNLV